MATGLTQPRSARQRAVQGGPAPGPNSAAPWWRSTWALGLAGSALLWAALPPLGWWPVAWVAPIPWLVLVRSEKLPGRRPYLALWVAGFSHWFALLHFLRLPHPAMSIGWVAMAFYMAFYLPAFVALARVIVHGWGWPLAVATPVAWTGLELFRGYFLTGFSMAQLGHTQYRWIEMVQIADLAGGYAVSFVVMAVAACLTEAVLARPRRARWRSLAVAAVVLAGTLAYGYWRTADEPTRPGPTVAIIQGSTDTEVKWDPTLADRVQEEYLGLTWRAVRGRKDIDLVVWPETMYRYPLLSHSDDAAPAPGENWTRAELDAALDVQRTSFRDIARSVGVPMLLGLDARHFGRGTVQSTNSAVLLDAHGEVRARYDKMHPVIFSHEYIPLGRTFPALYRMFGFSGGLEPGKQAVAVDVDGTRASVSICYEDVLPHLIARQVRELRAAGREPDFLINQTNDGWFWGSSELDLHLICAVFRAVECRMPMLVAANTGFSAHIDGSGRILTQGPRRAQAVLIAPVKLDDRRSAYLALGDWPAGMALAICAAAAVTGWRSKRRGAGWVGS